MVSLCALCEEKGYSVFLFGGQHSIVEQCTRQLQRRFPGLKISGTFEPPHVDDIEQFDNDDMIRVISNAKPHFLFVALGAPKQEKWIERLRGRLNVPVMMGVGGSFDILGGRVPRAPRWMRAMGLEWLFRLVIEPGRLARRYLLGIPYFILLVLKLSLWKSRK
jgi:N-acetylglucosaminyldiphosphoundecaprenol N-acetyl-beta-D-mannosaminyltransferase